MNSGKRITQIFCFIALDTADDCEGIPAIEGPHPLSGGGIMMPLVGADQARLEALIPLARQMVKQTGKKMRLVRFSQMEELGEITP
jgi:hypothetical protein